MPDKYPDFATLAQHERSGVDYRVLVRRDTPAFEGGGFVLGGVQGRRPPVRWGRLLELCFVPRRVAARRLPRATSSPGPETSDEVGMSIGFLSGSWRNRSE